MQWEEDPLMRLLERNGSVRAWFQEQVLGIHTDGVRYSGPLPEATLSVSGEFEPPAFQIPVELEQVPSDDQLNELLSNMSITPRAPKSSSVVVGTGAAIAANAFYLPQEATGDGWAMGTVITNDWCTFGLAAMLGYEVCDGLRLKEGRFVVSQKCGEMFEILVVRDGRALVLHNSHMAKFQSLRMYSPILPGGRWGTLLRTAFQYSMLDCMKCCGTFSGRSGGLRFCRCDDKPVLPVVTKPFASWFDTTQMFCDQVDDSLSRQKIYDGSGMLISSTILYQKKSLVRTSRDTLPLFQALVLDCEQFCAKVERPYVPWEVTCARVPQFERLLDSPAESSSFTPELYQKEETKFYSARGEDAAALTSNGSLESSEGGDSGGQFECDLCSRRFAARYNLKRHILTVHAQGLEHECEQCGMRFKLKNRLNVHIRQVHLGEKSHSCELCGKRFWSHSNLKRHVDEAHLKTRAFSCPQCPKKLSSKFNLDRHLANVHDADAAHTQGLPASIVET
uniref:C2H2-type domain-containing protein n=1 Tax=Erythrolobus madagascarensis TaxID=708628 RepID=A0A7S0T9A8_9RHOD|eukprot:CAMPEP_0185853040 /NCGR_PEP_ID=MMETSP1354-20130828/17259_1 /TAXON_ID=708628 /ORGANISM="Erythrolobus madagascarensis, Strain CCMP3276" /LENGTH=506 /DNA_ID=CAMNT_0028554437 /DNA_START=63 /DNA_END=1583 /DNA_ORIENTATION=+